MIPKSDQLAEGPIAQVCPHLGVLEDPQTCLSYPSRWNVCHLKKPAQQVELGDQARLCLSPVHARCLNFQGQRQATSH